MTLEWLRRRDPVFDRNLRAYLFTSAPITEIEVEVEEGAEPEADGTPQASSGSLGIGSLKEKTR